MLNKPDSDLISYGFFSVACESKLSTSTSHRASSVFMLTISSDVKLVSSTAIASSTTASCFCAFVYLVDSVRAREAINREFSTKEDGYVPILCILRMFMSLWKSLMTSCRCPGVISFVRAASEFMIDQMRSRASPSVIPTPLR